MLPLDEKKQIVKICKLYYMESWTQERIAAKYGVSRPVISKLLQRARDEGIVQITIHDDTLQIAELEREIEQKFELDQVFVVSIGDMAPDLAMSEVGKSAVGFIMKLVRNARRIGVSWGMTLHQIIREIPYEEQKDVRIIPLIGGMGRDRIELHSNQLAYEMSKKLGGKCESLYAPAIVESKDLRDALVKSPNIASVIAEGAKADLALVGIGNPYESSTMVEIGYLGQKELLELKKAGVVADVNSRFIKSDGSISASDINNKVIGIELEQLTQIGKVVGIAVGMHKLESILATLKGHYLDVLITDDKTAAALVQRMRSEA
ncbi:MAG TPA: sugar-binding transcriptional regulator [Bacilli bacterium]